MTLPTMLHVVTSQEVILVPQSSTSIVTPPMDNLLFTLIFYPYGKINSYVCHVIVDIGGCEHVVLESVLQLPRLSTTSYNLPYDISSEGMTSLMRLHGLPKSIISNHDLRFTDHFWMTLGSLLGTKLTISSNYHPQIDSQTDIVNRSVRKQLPSLVCKTLTTWDVTLPCLEFAYHSSTNHTTRVSPVETAHGFAPCKPLDIVPLDPHVRVSKDRVAFA